MDSSTLSGNERCTRRAVTGGAANQVQTANFEAGSIFGCLEQPNIERDEGLLPLSRLFLEPRGGDSNVQSGA